jgi:hypothetical protein
MEEISAEGEKEKDAPFWVSSEKHQSIHAISISGFVLLAIELVLLVYWFGTGIYISIADPAEISVHVLGSLHFPCTVALCLVLEHYHALRYIRGRQLAREHVDNIDDAIGVGYLMSWAVAIVAGLGTDVFSLINGIAVPRTAQLTIWIFELILAAWSTLDTILIIVWSIVVYIISRKLLKKISAGSKNR